MTRRAEGKTVAILATDGFEEVELTSPREALENAGAKVTIVSLKSGEIEGHQHREKGKKVKADSDQENDYAPGPPGWVWAAGGWQPRRPTTEEFQEP